MHLAYLLTLLTLLSLSTAVPTNRDGARSLGGTLSDILNGCKDHPADIFFLLDCSSSVWIVDFEKQLEFVVSLVQQFDINPTATRIGVGVFSDTYYPVVDIGGYPDENTLIRAIRATPYLSGNTYTGRGINGMRTHGFRDSIVRPNVTKIGIVVTDGRSRHRTITIDEATKAREAHIWLFAIGVGSNVDGEELAAIASQPNRDFAFHVSSFDVLNSLVQKLAINTCNLEQPQDDSATCGRDKKTDVMFLYNAAEMSFRSLDSVRDFMKYMVGEFSISSGNVRTGVVSQGCQGEDIQLSQYLRRDDLIGALMNQSRPKLSPLIKKVRLQGFDSSQGGRSDATKITIIFVDDLLTARDEVLYEAFLLKYGDVLVHVVTVGSSTDLGEMKQLASSPDYITHFDSYDQLRDASRRKAFRDKLCAGM